MSVPKSKKLKFPEVVVVEASAGSGKTYCLAKRYLQLLINSNIPLEFIPLRGILAITFTNKATIEMKERILDLLKKIALDAFDNSQEREDILGMLAVDKAHAQKKAQLVMDTLIKHYNFFQVQTIDSFINALLLGCALSIDRSARFAIKRDSGKALSYCLDLVVESAANDKEVFAFLDEFLEYYLFVENRNGWFPKEDILGLMYSLFRLTNTYGQGFNAYPGASSDVIKKKRTVYGQIEEIATLFPEGFNGSAKRHINTFLSKQSDIFDFGSLPAALKKSRAPMNKGKSEPAAFAEKWKRLYRGLQEFAELDSCVAYNPYVRLFRTLLKSFQKVSRKEDVLFLEELNRKARLLFDDTGITVAELYYRLATRFKHYLIDEFQDTSVLQWRNLEMMVEEGLSTGGSLFYVGDKKQAIYRFRGGEARLFDEVRKRFESFNVTLTHLTKNWRSQKAIVECNNALFSQENLNRFLSESGIAQELESVPGTRDEVAAVFADATQSYRSQNQKGFMRIEKIKEKNQAQRDEIVAPKIRSLIKELTKRFRHEDITILTRDNNEVELVTAWLLEAGIPVESEKTLNVTKHYLVADLIAFLSFLHSPIDDLAFAAFLLGDLFPAISGIAHEELAEYIFRLHKEKRSNRDVSLYRLFKEAYPAAWERLIEPFFRSVGFVSSYELTTSIYQHFDCLGRFPESCGFFMKFLELMKRQEEECPDLESFLLYLADAPVDDLYLAIASSNAVKVLTIHKSKGLEFPVVIIPFLRMDITPETGGKGTNSYVVTHDDGSLGLVRITKNHRVFSSFLQEVYTRAYQKACIDELNNLYVALTRAQCESYCFVPARSGATLNKAAMLFVQDVEEWGEVASYQIKTTQENPSLVLSPHVHKDWVSMLRSELSGVREVCDRRRVKQGVIAHAILSFIGNCQPNERVTLLDEAVRRTRRAFPFPGEVGAAALLVKEILSSPETEEFFCVAQGEVFCEKEVVNAFGDLKRIDRLIVTSDTVVVVDYKIAQASSDVHFQQVREYMDIVSSIYPNRRVRGVLIYLEENVVSEVTS